jgi:hypothetical protein
MKFTLFHLMPYADLDLAATKELLAVRLDSMERDLRSLAGV